tara:strand:+ start:55 stop:402 length:348 start_codon:yes stop_codon:yes gene_type:complete
MGLKDLFKKNLAKSERFKEMQMEARLQKMLEERQKSSNERELDRFYAEEREKSIKKNLEEFRKHRQEEAIKTTVLSGPNMFKGKGNIASGETTVLKNNNKLLAMKATKQKGMFFK